jgi:hypothetical protein
MILEIVTIPVILIPLGLWYPNPQVRNPDLNQSLIISPCVCSAGGKCDLSMHAEYRAFGWLMKVGSRMRPMIEDI